MPPAPCNKCRAGKPSEGDSWCLACSSLEVAQGLFKRRWVHAGIRAVAEESALSSARFIKALANLDTNLPGPVAERGELLLTPKAKVEKPPRSRSPCRDERPPIQRSAAAHRSSSHREDREGDRHRGREKEPERRGASEESYTEESEEEEPREEEPVVKREEEIRSERRHSEKPPEPPYPPKGSSHQHTHGKRKKNKRRGGTKHQKHWRERENPFKKSHRRLPRDQLELAQSARHGFERRAWRETAGLEALR